MKSFKNIIRSFNLNSFWEKLIKNVAAVFIGNTGASVINFLITIVLIRTLGNAQ